MDWSDGVTEKLYELDAYLREFEGRVVSHTDTGVILDRTAFYPTGGGQPNDMGLISYIGGTCKVLDVRKQGDAIVHVLDGEPSSWPPVAMDVHGILDWDRRIKHMRFHTALHSMAAVASELFDTVVTGGQITTEKARLDFQFAEYDPSMRDTINERLATIVAEDHPVSSRYVPRSEADSNPELIKTKVNLIPPHIDPIRIVTIEGVDMQADGGTHVASTAEMGAVHVAKVENKGKGFRRFVLMLGE